ncbi:MAG: hypothetical protein RIM72_14500 [Alphaproteobacteria bacterium]
MDDLKTNKGSLDYNVISDIPMQGEVTEKELDLLESELQQLVESIFSQETTV